LSQISSWDLYLSAKKDEFKDILPCADHHKSCISCMMLPIPKLFEEKKTERNKEVVEEEESLPS
jgi:hypothetical protein